MLSFESDYIEGAHPAILQRLLETKCEKLSGYGADAYCTSAKEKIRTLCACPQAEIHFLVGGTQTNQTVIASLLAQYEGVVAVDSGHINVHEAGAIEATGHKVLTLPGREGKLETSTLRAFLQTFYADGTHEHMVFPGMVYISHPTEYGTLYTRAELSSLRSVCEEYKMPLYLDGARLGYGLVAQGTDVTLADLARLCDVFYIGGTKVGALCGEAVVFPHGAPRHFLTSIKQHGAMLAKGRLLGVQFDTLFSDDLYFSISRNAIEKAETLKAAFRDRGYSFYLNSPTNQIFVILENQRMAQLSEKVLFSPWAAVDAAHTVVRFATSWATTQEDVSALITLL